MSAPHVAGLKRGLVVGFSDGAADLERHVRAEEPVHVTGRLKLRDERIKIKAGARPSGESNPVGRDLRAVQVSNEVVRRMGGVPADAQRHLARVDEAGDERPPPVLVIVFGGFEAVPLHVRRADAHDVRDGRINDGGVTGAFLEDGSLRNAFCHSDQLLCWMVSTFRVQRGRLASSNPRNAGLCRAVMMSSPGRVVFSCRDSQMALACACVALAVPGVPLTSTCRPGRVGARVLCAMKGGRPAWSISATCGAARASCQPPSRPTHWLPGCTVLLSRPAARRWERTAGVTVAPL